jgi:hypothetical protein
MAYIPVRSGFTDRREKHHQDLKLLQSLPIAERIKMMDSIARQNQSIGREIEFSNSAVSGRRWNLNAELAEKVDLLERAASAHSHSKHPGWQSFDYYTPFKGKSRFEKGAVEDASIYLPAVAGGKVTRGSGGGYGYFSESLDPSGRVIARVGHGNIDRPETGDINVLGAPPQAPVLPGEAPTTSDTRTKDILEAFMYGTQYQQPQKEKTLAETLKGELIAGALTNALAPRRSFLSSFVGQQPYLMGQAASTSDYLAGYPI